MPGLPFLQPKKLATVIMAKRQESGTTMPSHEEGEHEPALLSAAEDLISAVHAKDANAVAEALKAAFQIADSEEDEGDEE